MRASEVAKCCSELESRLPNSGDDGASRLAARLVSESVDVVDAAAEMAVARFFDNFAAKVGSRMSANGVVTEGDT